MGRTIIKKEFEMENLNEKQIDKTNPSFGSATPSYDRGDFDASLNHKIDEIREEIYLKFEESKEDAYKLSMASACILFGAQAVIISVILMFGAFMTYWASALVFGSLFLVTGYYLFKSEKESLKAQNRRLHDTIEGLKDKFH